MSSLPPERDAKDFRFQQLCKLRLCESPATLLQDRAQLLVVSNRYGLTFIGVGKILKVLRTADLSTIDQEHFRDRNTAIVTDFPVWATAELPALATRLAISCDDLTLAVAVTEGDNVFVLIYDVRSFATQGSTAKPFQRIRFNAVQSSVVLDMVWNPVLPNLLVAALSDGSVELLEITVNLRLVASLKANTGARCVCWSPKGKQLVVGKQDGTLMQYDQDLKEKRKWDRPSIVEELWEVMDITWISTYMFLAAYVPMETQTADQPHAVLITGAKEGTPTYTDFEDTCYGTGEDRRPQYFYHTIQKWEMILASSNNAAETAVIGKHLDDKTNWERWNLDDASRAELPLTESHTDSYPTGVAIDFSSQVQVDLGDNKSHPPCPMLLLLTTDCLLVPYYLVNLHPEAPKLTTPTETLSAIGARTGNVLSTDAKPAGPTIGSSFQFVPSKPVTLVSSTTTSVPAVTSTAAQAAQPSGNLFGGGTTQSSFKISTQPSSAGAFNFSLGQTPNTSFQFGNSSTVGAATPPTSTAAFSTPASTPPPAAAFSFSQTPRTESSSVTITTQAPPSAGFSISSSATTANTTSLSAFNFTAPVASNAPAVSIAGTTGMIGSSAGVVSSTTGMIGSSAGVASSAAGMTSLLSGPSTSALQQTPANTASFGAPVSLFTKPASTIFSASKAGHGPVQGQTTPPVVPETNATAPSSNTMAQFNIPQSVPGKVPPAYQFPTGISSLGPPAPSRNLPNAGIVVPTKPVEQTTPITPPSPGPPTLPSYPMSRVPVAGSTDAGSRSITEAVDSTFTNSIVEEILHFEQELRDLKNRAKNYEAKVGTKEEAQKLRKSTDNVDNFCTEIKATTQEQNKEIQDQKIRCLDMYSMVEECRMRKQRNNDPKYMTLLKSRALDPASTEKLRFLQQQQQLLDQGLKDVDLILDTQWQEHQEQKKKNWRIRTPTNDSVYRAVKGNHNLILAHRTRLDQLEQRLKELKLYNKSSPWQMSGNCTNSRTASLPSREDSQLTADTSLLSQSRTSLLTPSKEAMLREHLSHRMVPKVKSTRPENLNMSRLVSLETAKRVMTEQPAKIEEKIPDQTKDPVITTRTTALKRELGKAPVQQFSQAEPVSRPQLQSLISSPFQPQVSTLAPFAQKENFGIVPGSGMGLLGSKPAYVRQTGPTSIGQIQLEDITPPSSTTTDNGEDDYEEDDEDDYEDDEDEVEEIGFGLQFNIPKSGEELKDTGRFASNTSTPTRMFTGSLPETKTGSASFSRNLFGSPAAPNIALMGNLSSGKVLTTPADSADVPSLTTSQPSVLQTATQPSAGIGFNFSMAANTSANFAFGGGSSLAQPPSNSLSNASSIPDVADISGRIASSGILGKLLIGDDNSKGETESSTSKSNPAVSITGTNALSAFSQPPVLSAQSEAAKTTLTVTKTVHSTVGTATVDSSFQNPVGGLFNKPNTTVTTASETTVTKLENPPVSNTGLFSQTSSASVTTTASMMKFGGGLLGSAPASSTTSSFGDGAGGIFGQTSATPAQGLFGNGPSSGSIFGQSSSATTSTTFGGSTTAPTLESPAVTETVTPVPPQTTTSSGFSFSQSLVTTSGSAGTTVTTTSSGFSYSASSPFSNTATTTVTQAPTTASSSLFSATGIPATASVFGQETTSTTQSSSPLFGSPAGDSQPAASTSSSLFGGTATTSATSASTSLFGGSGTTATTSASAPLFGGGSTTATTAANASLFGGTATTTATSASTSLFGGGGTTATTSANASLFGGTATTTAGFSFAQPSATTSTGALFSGTSTTSSSGFGFGQTSTSQFGQPSSGGFGSPAFGESVQFGQSTSAGFGQGGSVFGQQSAAPSGGLFGKSTAPVTEESSVFGGGGGGLFGGLGGKPSAENANKNVFGTTQPFGTGDQSSAGLFGNQGPTSFGNTGTSEKPATFGSSFTSGNSSVGSLGFGVANQPSSPSAGGFGAAPAFGGSPTIGSGSGFGSKPAFGASPGFGGGFGSPPSFGSPAAAAPSVFGTSSQGGFATFAQGGSPTFGSLAQATDPPTFGGMTQETGGGFGSTGFGTTGSSSQTGLAPSFTGYRS